VDLKRWIEALQFERQIACARGVVEREIVRLGGADKRNVGGDWREYDVQLSTGADVAISSSNRFVLSFQHPGTIWLDYVSLKPPAYHNRANGTRADLMDKMAAMKPAFLRFPGGNYVEGNRIAERFDWKKTVGNPVDRPGHLSPWGYPSSDGFGLLEFLEWCEDLNMQPVLAVYAGYSLQGEHVAPGPALQPYVNDAIDEIEYVTGDASTKWGSQRAKDGHPEPFSLHYVEIGNEDFFDKSGSYDGRFAQFYKAIKAKYPSLELIATTKVKREIEAVLARLSARPRVGSPQDFAAFVAAESQKWTAVVNAAGIKAE
jgi:alpha-L-arabinofuranosidase